MFRIKLAIIIGGGVLFFFGCQEFRVSMGTSSEPVAVSLAELEKGTALTNNHVVLDSHLAIYAASVYSYTKKKYESGPPGAHSSVSYCYYPVISSEHPFMAEMSKVVAKQQAGQVIADAEYPTITNFKVLVKTRRFKTIGEIPDSFQREERLQGLVVNRIESLDSKERELIVGSFPALNLDQLLLLEADRHPASIFKSGGMMLGGVLLCLLGLGLFFMGSSE